MEHEAEKSDLSPEYFSAEANGYKVVRYGRVYQPGAGGSRGKLVNALVSAQITDTVYVPWEPTYPQKGNGPLTVFADYATAKEYYDMVIRNMYTTIDRYRHELWACNYEPAGQLEQDVFPELDSSQVLIRSSVDGTGDVLCASKSEKVWYRVSCGLQVPFRVEGNAFFIEYMVFSTEKEALYPRTVMAKSVMLMHRILCT